MINKRIVFEADPTTWPCRSEFPEELNQYISGNDYTVDLEELLLHIAQRTTSSSSESCFFSDEWAKLKYLKVISEEYDMKLAEGCERIDSHQKAIISDDFGVGISSVVLTNIFDLKIICHTNYVINHISRFEDYYSSVENLSIDYNNSSKRGPNKSPDYIAVDGDDNFFIFECKGTQSSRSALERQLQTGKSQKENLVIECDGDHPVIERLVTGLYLPKYSNNTRAYFKIIDPIPENEITIKLEKKKKLVEIIIRGSLIESLKLIGFNSLKEAFTNEIGNIKNYEDKIIKEIEYYENNKKDKKSIIHGKDEFVIFSDFSRSLLVYDNELGKFKTMELSYRGGFKKEHIDFILKEKNTSIFIKNLLEKNIQGNNSKYEKWAEGNKYCIITPLGFYLELEFTEDILK